MSGGLRPGWSWWLVLSGIIALFVAHALYRNFICDDAFIAFRYAWNWVEHGEIAFNIGERVEGYTSFLWMASMAAGLAIGLDPAVVSRILGVTLGALGLFIITEFIGRFRGRYSAWDGIAALLLAFSPAYATWSTGGLETQLFTLLVTLAWTRYLNEAAGNESRLPMSGFLFGLATLARPEGALFAAAAGIHCISTVWRDGRRFRPTRGGWIWVGGFLSMVIPHICWRWLYYGWLLPNTYYAKVGAEGLWGNGFHYLTVFAVDHAVWLVLIVATLIPSALSSHENRVRNLLLLQALILAAYIVRVGGDFMALHRFLVPILPGLSVVAVLGLRSISQRLRRTALPVVGTGLLSLAILVGLGWQVARVEQSADRPTSARGIDSIRHLDNMARNWSDVGRWLANAKPPETSIAVNAAGAIPYHSRLRALDVRGLTDEWIAHHVEANGHRPGHTKKAPNDYVLEKDLDILIFHPQIDMQSPPEPVDPTWRNQGYRWKTVRISEEQPFWFGFWERETRQQR